MGKITDKISEWYYPDIPYTTGWPQAAILELTNEVYNIYNLNCISLVSKCYTYRSREKHVLNIDILIDNLIEIKKKEKRISVANNSKTETCNEKWCITDNVLPVT